MSKTKCEHCGEEFERKDMNLARVINDNGQYIRDTWLCEDCWEEESADCEGCGQRCYPKDNLLNAPQYNDHTKTYKSYKFCGSCFDKKCIKCDKCGAILDRNHPEHDECYAVGNEMWCEDCVSEYGWICACCCKAHR